jgi:hypothetical protein
VVAGVLVGALAGSLLSNTVTEDDTGEQTKLEDT